LTAGVFTVAIVERKKICDNNLVKVLNLHKVGLSHVPSSLRRGRRKAKGVVILLHLQLSLFSVNAEFPQQ